jgi:hypothetical protein
MGRIYAGVLGPLAFLISLVRGAVHAVSTNSTVFEATIYLLVFAMIGALVGQIAAWIVDDSVRARLAAEMAAATVAANAKAAAKVAPVANTNANNKTNLPAATKTTATVIKPNAAVPAIKK